ncbi:MAG: hypothetical protein H3C48_02740 [Chitinophagaceae bacterium]|nr:hypothetical protein [Chitinophagaceae bacterium]
MLCQFDWDKFIEIKEVRTCPVRNAAGIKKLFFTAGISFGTADHYQTIICRRSDNDYLLTGIDFLQ